MLKHLFDKIQEYDSIVLFRHILPDMDALGSQLGLKVWIQSLYPEKKVYAVGEMGAIAHHFIDSFDEVSDEVLSQSLAVITDTSAAHRVDDQRYKEAAYTIRIDHHVPIETFCDWEYIDQHASATCEILALASKEMEIDMPSSAAQYLYSGLVADNIRFTTNNVTARSFEAGGYLFEKGVDVISCEEINFGSSYSDYCYENKVRNNSKRQGNVLYSIMSMDDYKDISFPQAKEKVYALAGVTDIAIWALFTEREPGVYNVSLRSKRIDVRGVAQKYNGGGHACACGIKNVSLEQIREMVKELEEIAE